MKRIFNLLEIPNCWFRLFLILFIVFIFSGKLVLSQSTAKVIVSGAGTVAVNGTYTYTGMANNRPYYTFGKYRVEYRDGGYGLEWEIWDTNETNLSYEIKYFNTSTGNTPPTSTWSIDVATPPAPSVSYIDIPIISTNAASSVSSNSATLGGNITSDGGSSVTERGVVYSTTDTILTIGQANVTQVTGGSGIGKYDIIINALTASTVYHVKAYAINTAGTSYGKLIEFTTPIGTYSENITNELFVLSPNPTNDGFYINAGSKMTSLIIYDFRGNTLISRVVKGYTFIDVNTLKAGVYIVKLREQNIKLIKK